MVQIVSVNQDPREARAERLRMRQLRLATVVASQGWPDFRELCEMNARRLEQDLLRVEKVQDVRVMDRAIGRIAAYREMTVLVEKAAREYMRAMQAAAGQAEDEQEQVHDE